MKKEQIVEFANDILKRLAVDTKYVNKGKVTGVFVSTLIQKDGIYRTVVTIIVDKEDIINFSIGVSYANLSVMRATKPNYNFDLSPRKETYKGIVTYAFKHFYEYGVTIVVDATDLDSIICRKTKGIVNPKFTTNYREIATYYFQDLENKISNTLDIVFEKTKYTGITTKNFEMKTIIRRFGYDSKSGIYTLEVSSHNNSVYSIKTKSLEDNAKVLIMDGNLSKPVELSKSYCKNLLPLLKKVNNFGLTFLVSQAGLCDYLIEFGNF